MMKTWNIGVVALVVVILLILLKGFSFRKLID